jgi:hypothetical protein
MKKLKISVILLALLLVGLTLVPAVSAAKSIEGRVIGFNATQAQVDKINQLWGKDISVGEYYAQVEPEMLVGMPADLKAILYKKQWVWPGSSGIPTVSPMVSGITCTAPLPTKVNGVVIQFSGSATSVGSGAPYYMAFTTYLENSAGQVKASTGASGFNPTTYLTSSNMWQPTGSGTYHSYTTAFTITPNYDAVPVTSGSITWP